MIRNLLFDLGGVIMDICKDNCVAAFERLGLPDAPSYFGDFSQQGPFMLLERGDITPSEFRAELRAKMPQGTADEAIDSAFCAFLTGIPPHRLDSLYELRRRFKVYLLSNTNPIMWNSRIAAEFRSRGKRREDYFDGMVTSFEARALKPDERIFIHAARTLGIDPAETLFLDDSQTNLDAAARLGFATALVKPGMEFADVLVRIMAESAS